MNNCGGIIGLDQVSMSSFGVDIYNTSPIVRRRLSRIHVNPSLVVVVTQWFSSSSQFSLY